MKWIAKWLRFLKLRQSSVTSVTSQAPHQRWPEVLRWKQGDVFDCCTSDHVNEVAPELIAVRPDGYAYCWSNCLHDNKVVIPVRYLVGRNETLRTRQIDHEIHEESDEYMNLLREFNNAVDELEKRDQKLKLAS